VLSDKMRLIILCLLDRASLWQLNNKRPTWCHLLFYFTSYVLNMFRTLIYPLSGACDYSIELQHWSIVLGSMCVGVSVWLGWSGIRVAGWSVMMDTLMSETCWAHKWNKIASDIKLIIYSLIITMLHGPINIKIFPNIFISKILPSLI